MTRPRKPKAPKPPPLRLKWEPWEHGRRDLYRNAYRVVDAGLFVARSKNTGQWCYAWSAGSTPAVIASRIEAQLGAESAAREHALNIIRKAEAIWPGIIEEAAKERIE